VHRHAVAIAGGRTELRSFNIRPGKHLKTFLREQSALGTLAAIRQHLDVQSHVANRGQGPKGDRKSTRLNSSHVAISYAVFCLKKKKKKKKEEQDIKKQSK